MPEIYTAISILDQKVTLLDEKVAVVDSRLDKLEPKVDIIGNALHRLDERTKITNNFVIGIAIAVLAGICLQGIIWAVSR